MVHSYSHTTGAAPTVENVTAGGTGGDFRVASIKAGMSTAYGRMQAEEALAPASPMVERIAAMIAAGVADDRSSKAIARAVLKEMREYDRALAALDRAVEVDPKSPRPLVTRAEIFVDKKENDRAITELDAAIRLDPAHAPAYTVRGNVYYRKGENVV